MYDLIVIGGGPAGITAAALAIQRRLETLIICEKLGGKAVYAAHLLEDVEGYETITGERLLSRFLNQIRYLDFARCHDRAVQIEPCGDYYIVRTRGGEQFETRAIIVCTGVSYERLPLPEDEQLIGRGISYSVFSHGPLFLGKDVAVYGYKQRALLAAAELAQGGAHHVYLIAPQPLAEENHLLQRLRAMDNVTIHEGATIEAVTGENYVEGITVRLADGSRQQIPVKGLFVKLDVKPNSELVADLVELDEEGYIKVDKEGHTSRPGIFAAGDVEGICDLMLASIGEGVKAMISACEYLLTR